MMTRIFHRTLAAGLALLSAGTASAALDLSWYSIDGGGVMFSSGGGLELGATIAQADAGVLTGGSLRLVGGFWSAAPACGGDVDGDLDVDLDDLLLVLGNFGDPGPGAPGDVDGDGDTDLDDLLLVLGAFGNVC